MVRQGNRKIDWLRMILAFLIAVFLFSFGIFMGYIAKGVLEQSVSDIEQETRNEILTLETLRDLIGQNSSCDTSNLDFVSQRLDYVGQLITTLEVRKGKFDSNVLEMKKLYSILEVRHILLTTESNQRCGSNYSEIFFFYSNQKECTDEVQKTSFILTYLRNKYSHVRVYSFDGDLDSELVKYMVKKYKVNLCTAVIFDGEKFEGKIEDAESVEWLVER